MHTLLYGDDMTKTFSTDQKPQALYVSELLTYYTFFLLIMKAHNIPIIMNKYYKTCRCAVTGSLKLDNFIILTFIAIVYHDWF